MEAKTFRGWLAERLGDEPGQVSRRELARRLADRNPGGGDPESYRSSLRRILAGERNPTQATRDAIQDALDDHSAPDDDDASQPITREMVVSKLRELRHDSLRLERALLAGWSNMQETA